MAEQNKEFEKESKEAIKAVFVKFDKDKSGELDYSEIKLVAQELGVSLETNDLQNIFKELDVNKDQKISFEEFWEWWKLGRPNKLEKMIYFKLRSMKLLKKAHTDFTRLGSSLDVKYDKSIDKFYMALNYGTHPGETRVQAKIHLNTVEGEDLIRETLEGFARNENEQDHEEIVAFVIRVKSQKPEEAAKSIQFLIDSLKTMLLQLAGDTPSSPLTNTINLVKIDVNHTKNEVIIKFSFPSDIYQGFIGDDPVIGQIRGLYAQILYQTNLNLTFTAGIKNSLKKMSQNLDQKFIDWLFEGFLIELSLQCNRSFIEQSFSGISFFLKQQLETLQQQYSSNQITQEQYEKASSSITRTLMMMLIRSAKVHIVFKDMKDTSSFFSGMGLSDLAKSQPSCKELLEEFKQEQNNFSHFKDESSYWNIVYKFLNTFKESCEGQASFSFIYKKAIVQFVLSIEGIGEIFDFIMK